MFETTMTGLFSLENSLQAIGVVGALCYLSAYFLLQSGYIGGNSNAYTFMIMIGAVLVLCSLYVAFNYASFIIQISWISISIFGLTRIYFFHSRIHFSDEENRFLNDKFPALPAHLQRKILKLGIWKDSEKGTLLTKQNKPNKNLIYLATGSANVFSNSRIIGRCLSNNFIGEMTLTQNDPATATVILSANARYLEINAAKLRDLIARDKVIAQAVEASFYQDMKSKLQASNKKLEEIQQSTKHRITGTSLRPNHV